MRHFRLESILLYLHRISVFTQNLGQTRCGKYYADAEAKTEITQASTVIPATGRRPTSTTPAASVSSPKTGDAGVALYAGMAILSLTGCAWLRRKEK